MNASKDTRRRRDAKCHESRWVQWRRVGILPRDGAEDGDTVLDGGQWDVQ